MSEALVSVILPVYNVENYLRRAIQSVREQTYTNIEIILVDDGSTDSSGGICDQESVNNPRIIVVHKENGGLSSARNAGISIAQGKYLFFLDPDDVIELGTIALMVQTMEEKHCDLVICGIISKYVNKNGVVYQEKSMLLEKEGLYRPIDLLRCYRSDEEIKRNNVEVSCNKLYKASMLGKGKAVFGEHIKFCEDSYFFVEFIVKCSHVYYIKKELYHYYRYNVHSRQTLMNSFNGNRFAVYKELYLKVYSLMNKLGSETDISRCKHNFADRAIFACIMLCRIDVPHTEEETKKILYDIVTDESVVEVMPYYQRKSNNSWTVPLLIKLKKIDYLFYFARKIARRRYGL